MLRLVHSMQRTNAPRNAAWASAKPYCRVSAAAVQPPLERDRQGRCGVSSGYSERTLRDDVCAFGHQVLFECVDAHGALLRVEMLHATIHHATMQHAMYHAASHATCDVHAQPATLCAAQLCFALLCYALRCAAACNKSACLRISPGRPLRGGTGRFTTGWPAVQPDPARWPAPGRPAPSQRPGRGRARRVRPATPLPR